MPRDIRSFFKPIPKSVEISKPSLKKRPIPIDSSDEDVVETTPQKLVEKEKKVKRRKIVSDSEEDTSRKDEKREKKGTNENVKKVNATDVFGGAPVQQSKVEKKVTHIKDLPQSESKNQTRKKLKTEIGTHDNPNFEKTLQELDEGTRHSSKNTANKSKNKEKIFKTEIGTHNNLEFEKTLLDLDEDVFIDNVNFLDKTVEEALKVEKTPLEKTSTKRKQNDDDNEIDEDQERYEKRVHSAVLYKKYLNRSGPAHIGEKERPKGKPNCLKNLCFLRTGVLDSLENDQFIEIITEHGGRIVKAVSKKINYVVIGEDPGPAKLEKARNYGIPTINEDQLFDMILVKSGMKPKYCVSQDTEDNDIIDEKAESSSKRAAVTKVSNKKEVVEAIEGTSSKRQTVEKIGKEIYVPKKKSLSKTPEHPQKKIKTEGMLPVKIIDKKVESSTEIKSNSFYKSSPSTSKLAKDIFGPTISESNFPKSQVHSENLAWTEKYKPNSVRSIIGQQGDKSNMKKLLSWLQNWHKNHSGKYKPKLAKPSPWAKNDDGAFFKCALLSGSPGVGKTTTATLVAKELGFDIVEMNASDTRSKKLLQDEVSQLLSTTSLAGFLRDGAAPTKKRVLLMDEVDGMAGNEDRGGIQELIALIKNTSVPIICMCNDRNHQKLRSLVNHCFDLRFTKPRLEQIRGAMLSVCYKEGLNITPDALSEIITGTGMDVRQTLNHLAMWTANNKNLTFTEAKAEADLAKKDPVIGPWEVVRKVFSKQDHKNMSLGDKSRLFFFDYSLGPLFVQENYLQVVPDDKSDLLGKIALTADSISMGDLIDRKIRNTNSWSLLEVQAMYASVLPGHYLEGHVGGQINFPGWLGKNSKEGKFRRFLSELQAHTRTSTSATQQAMNLDYIYHFRDNIINPLVKEGTNGVAKSVEVMQSYNLLRDDLDSILELSLWPRKKDPMAMVDSKVKAAFTRAYNKDVSKLPYSVCSTVKKRTVTTTETEEALDGDDDTESTHEDDDITKDAMIKAKKTKKGSGEGASKKKGYGEGTSKKTGKGGRSKKNK